MFFGLIIQIFLFSLNRSKQTQIKATIISIIMINTRLLSQSIHHRHIHHHVCFWSCINIYVVLNLQISIICKSVVENGKYIEFLKKTFLSKEIYFENTNFNSFKISSSLIFFVENTVFS